MARYIFAAEKPDRPVFKMISLEQDGIRVLYDHPGDIALIIAYILKPGSIRYGWRKLTAEETEAYWRHKASLTQGAFI